MGRPYEDVRLEGHIVDSLVLPRVLDDILDLGGDYEILEIQVGRTHEDLSRALLRVEAKDEDHLETLLRRIQRHGATAVEADDALLEPAPSDGVFPEDFYSTTNLETFVRVSGRWVAVQNPEMDCGIVVEAVGQLARTVPLFQIKRGEMVVVGGEGIRVIPLSRPREARPFEFMTSEVSSEKPKTLALAEVARLMRRTHQEGRKILAVAGPAVVHTGASPALAHLVREGWIDVLFGGNAVAAHDVEACLFGTSLGVDLSNARLADAGHEHHLRAINRIRRAGGLEAAVETGVLTSGLMYEVIKAGIPLVLAGSIRDDGPLPEVITDVMEAQQTMRERIRDVGLCLMLSTMLHSVATGNLLPATVATVCVDINPAVVTKLADRGTFQTIGIVTDVGLFLGDLASTLATPVPS